VGLIWSKLLERNKNVVSNQLMHLVDWLPTLYAAAGKQYFMAILVIARLAVQHPVESGRL
jgi:hypothetical protein